MKPRLTIALRRCAGIVGLAALLSTTASAATHTFTLFADTDNDTGTGCTVATARGALPGIETAFVATITTSATDARVTRLERRTCSGASLGAAVAYDTTSWPVGLGQGSGGTAVIELYALLTALPEAGTVKAVVASTNATGGQDATAPFLIAFGGGTIVTPATPVPLSRGLLVPLTLVVVAIGVWGYRRGPHTRRAAAFVALFVIAGLAWAASVSLDGNPADWSGIAPSVTDPAGNAPPNADLVAVFQQRDPTRLFLRIDADVRVDVAGNQPPVVSAGASQSIVLPASATLAGVVSDDGLPSPPAAITLAWSKVSGPGSVTFGNAGAAVSTASFSINGVYVLRLTASDGALSSHADVTITVGATGTVLQLDPVADVRIPVNTGINLRLTGHSTDALATLSYLLVDGPVGALVTSAGAFTFSAETDQLGAHPVTVQVSDGNGHVAQQAFAIDVVDRNHRPVLAAQPDASTGVGATWSRALVASDADAGDALTFTLLSGPAGMTLNGSTLTWTPTAAQLGNWPVEVQVTDRAGRSTARRSMSKFRS